MAKQATAKTPTVAIARVLRSLGLEQGKDFRVRGQYQGTGANRERIGTYVAVYTNAADQVVADNADRIEELVKQDGSFAFRVSIHSTTNGRVWTWIANFGSRTRDGWTGQQDPSTTGSDAPAEEARKAVKDIEQRPGRTGAPVITATLGAARPAFEQPGSDRYMGATVTIAAMAAQDVILEHAWVTRRMEEAATQWPKGTRVQGVDSYGVTCTGTVNGVSWGVVTDPDHKNYGRTWVDVTWDEYPHNKATGRRNRPFTSDLIKH